MTDHSELPDAQQCAMPTCPNPAVDPTRQGGLCREHYPDDTGADDSATDDAAPDRSTTERDSDSADEYITVDGFGEDDIAAHYDRARRALEPLGQLAGHPTIGLDDFTGWYVTTDNPDPDDIAAGYPKRRRVARLARDYDTVLDRLDRSYYALTSYKTDAAFREWAPARLVADDDGDGHHYEYRDGRPTPDADQLMAVAAWGDIDLVDDLKPQRGRLDPETRAMVEAALDAYVEEVAQLYGGRDAVSLLDSVGGAYLFGAPEATLPIAESFDDPEARATVFAEFIDRSNDYLRDAQQRVEERIDGAAEVLDPDWANNPNRQYKAPLSLHTDHDAVVTPIDVADISYDVTTVDAVDADLIDRTQAWTEQFTAPEHTDRVATVVETLWPDYYAEADDWQAALEAWLDDAQSDQRTSEAEDALDDFDADTTAGDTNTGDTDAGDGSERGGDAKLVTSMQRVFRRAHALDTERILRQYAVDRWDTRERTQDHITRFAPAWRSWTNGEACFYNADDDVFGDASRGGGGHAVKAYALGAGIIDHARDDLDGAAWLDAVDGLRSEGYDIPVYVPEAGSARSGGGTYDRTPLWALRKAALALDICSESTFVDREADDGSTYQHFPGAETYNATLDALDAHGIDHGRERWRGTDDPHRDPLDPDVVFEPAAAYAAAKAVTPDVLDEARASQDDTETPALDLPSTADCERWVAPNGDRIGLIRAVALAEGLIGAPDESLDGGVYARAYDAARERYGAPLPEYVDAATATENYDLVKTAVRELRGQQILDQLDSAVTDEHPPGQDAVAVLDPTWEDSDSGERIVLFRSGLFFCRKHEVAFGPLTAVALEQGHIDAEDDTLAGEDFRTAYHDARELYGAPLPEWQVGDDVEQIAVVPEPETVVEDFIADATALSEARSQVETLFGDLADRDPEARANARAHVLRALPALGKTTAAVLYAQDNPVTYLGPRKELMQEVMQKATGDDIPGLGSLEARYIPVFAESQPSDAAIGEALGLVREEGKDLLQERSALLERIDAPLDPDADDDSEDPLDPGATIQADRRDDDEDDIHIDRPSCQTANGAGTPDDDARAWWLAVHVARELGHTPREIHVNAETLFGDPLPCQADGDHCHYSTAWETITDPDVGIDLLIGHYVHGYVGGACTDYRRDGDGGIVREPRTVVADEFPGRDHYTSEFGDEYREHARWLAGALHDDVADVMDLREVDLWDDPFIRQWLRGDVILDGHDAAGTTTTDSDGAGPESDCSPSIDAARRAHSHLRVLDGLARAQAEARRLLERSPDALEALGIQDVLAALAGEHGGADPEDPALPAPAVEGWYNALLGVVANADSPGEGRSRLVQRLDDHVLDPLATAARASSDLADLPADLPGGGELHRVLEQAVSAVVCGAETAVDQVRAAQTVLEGGEDGTRALARHATDGYAHPEANYLLYGILADGPDVTRLRTDNFGWGDRLFDGTNVKTVDLNRATVLVDRNEQGADIHKPPAFRATTGDLAPVIGLDATARAPLWEVALGTDVETADIHESHRERRRFLREVMNLQVVQASSHAHYWEGDPDGKDVDSPAALLEAIDEQYAGRQAEKTRRRHLVDRTEGVETSQAAVVTTKNMCPAIEARAGEHIGALENYGNIIGSNQLANHNLGAVLGAQHFGDHEIEYWAALAGEAVTRTGRGMSLSYGSRIANELLEHMRRDKTMQALLRFGRSEEGAVVFAYTACLRDDLPVVGDAAVLTAHSRSRQAVARAAPAPGSEFTVSDIVDEVECTRRHVQRVLDEFAQLGYLRKHDPGAGLANAYQFDEAPGAGDADLPTDEVGVDSPTPSQTDGLPDERDKESTYTWNVGVPKGDQGDVPSGVHSSSGLPAPANPDRGEPVAAGTEPPG